MGSSGATDKDQSALLSPLQFSVATQTDSSVAETPSSPETSTALPSLQPVPYMKNALRASKFNRLEEQACLSKEITLDVGTKVVCFLDLLIQLFAEKCRQPGCQLATTVSHTLCGTSVLIKWKCPAGHVGKFWSSHKVNGVLANNLQACGAVLLSGNNFAQVESFWVCRLYRGRHFVGHKGCIAYQLSMSGGLGSKVLSTMSCKAKALL